MGSYTIAFHAAGAPPMHIIITKSKTVYLNMELIIYYCGKRPTCLTFGMKNIMMAPMMGGAPAA
jgi:hypothetical protein